MVTRVDLRVHTTAPSSRRDDEKFKAQAKAYDAFVVATMFKSVPAAGTSSTSEDGLPPSPPPIPPTMPTHTVSGMLDIPDQQADETTEVTYDPNTFLEETQLGYSALESQLFAPPPRTPKLSSKFQKTPVRGVEEKPTEPANSDSNDLRTEDPRHDESSSSHRIPSQSSYLRSPVLDRSNKKPRLSETNRRFFGTKRTVFPPVPLLQEDAGLGVGLAGEVKTTVEADDANIRDRRSSNPEGYSASGDDVTSELPTSYSLSDMTSASSRSKHQSAQRSLSDPGPTQMGTSGHGSEEREPSQRPRQESQPICAEDQTEETGTPKQPVHAVPPVIFNSETAIKDFARPAVVPSGSPSVPDPSSHFDLPTSIRPPPPKPTLNKFETHITQPLEFLDKNANVSKSYKPVFTTRELRQSERGHWSFDITTWPSELRVEFFQFLTKVIEQERAGWGVWCVREPSALRVQVFCWGEIVRHIFYVLYVASKSQVRKLGLQWIDAEGEVVVQMRGPDD